jgi:hypothetical protein
MTMHRGLFTALLVTFAVLALVVGLGLAAMAGADPEGRGGTYALWFAGAGISAAVAAIGAIVWLWI